jgi:hypothetical protein
VSFSPNGSSAISLANNEKKKGLLAVTCLAAGIYNVQLDTNYKALLDGGVHVQTASDNASQWSGRVIGFTSNTTNGSMVLIGVYKGATATNVNAATGNTVTLSLALSRSNVWT